MSASRRSRRGHGGESHGDDHPDERWMASYMDMITVLMCMFIVLFAMSSVDASKFAALKESLATGFGVSHTKFVDSASGTVVKPSAVTKKGDGYSTSKTDAKTATAANGVKATNSDAAGSASTSTTASAATTQTSAQIAANTKLATKEVDDLTAIQKAIAQNLAAKGLSQDVTFTVDARGLTVRLVGSETFFGSNSADLSTMARSVMDAIAPVLKGAGHDVSVEGHADSRDSTYPYATNWELSSARATGVLRDLVERGGMPPVRILAVGYGSSRPLSAGTTDADLAKNRRVDIVVLSNQKDDVNALIPKIAAAEAQAAK
jgi:chemotaxis protein MotB